jgi:hypothetical protein
MSMTRESGYVAALRSRCVGVTRQAPIRYAMQVSD